MAENWGMLNNIAGGIREGLIAFQTAAKNKRDQQLFDQQQSQLDPNSSESVAFRKFANENLGMKIPDEMSAAQGKEYAPLAGAQIRAKSSQDMADLALGKGTGGSEYSKQYARGFLISHPDYQKTHPDFDPNTIPATVVDQIYKNESQEKGLLSKEKIAGEANQTKLDVTGQNNSTKKDINAAKLKAKQGNGYASEKEFDNTYKAIMSARSEPDTKQQLNDLYAASKAQELARKFKNPNDLSNQEVNLLVSEVAKIAGGGKPTLEEMHALTPNAYEGQLKGWVSKLINEPTKANAGEFVKRYMEYADALAANARQKLSERTGMLISSKHFSPDQLSRLKPLMDRYSSPAPGQGLIGGQHQGPAQPDANDQKAMQWLKDPNNQNSPAAQGVIKKLKAKGLM